MITAWLIAVAVGFAAAAGFCVQYATGTRGWYRDVAGRILMAVVGLLAALLGLSLLVAVVRLPPLLFLVGMYALDAALLALWWLLRREQRHSKIEKNGDQ